MLATVPDLLPKNPSNPSNLALVPDLEPSPELLVSISTSAGLIALLSQTPTLVKGLLTPPMLYFTAAALVGLGVGVRVGSQPSVTYTVALLRLWANDPSLSLVQKAGKIINLLKNPGTKPPNPSNLAQDQYFETLQKQPLWKSIIQARQELNQAIQVYHQRPDDDNNKILTSKLEKLRSLLKKLQTTKNSFTSSTGIPSRIPKLTDDEHTQREQFQEQFPDNADLLWRAIHGDPSKLKEALRRLRQGQVTSEIIAALDGTQGSGGQGPRGPGQGPKTGTGSEESPWRTYYQMNLGRPPEGTLVRWINQLITNQQPLPGTALVLGTGDGAETAYLISQGMDVTGVDSDKSSKEFVLKSINLRRQKPNSKPENFGKLYFTQALFQTFQLPPKESIGLIWSASLPFLRKNELPIVLERLKPTLSKNGTIVTTFFGPNHPLANQENKAIYTENELRSVFNKNYKIIQINRISPQGKLGDGTPVILDLYEVIARKK